MNMSRMLKVMVVALVVTALGFSVSGAFAQSGSHTSSQFQGPKANKGTVTHSTKDGKSVLTLSDDFVVPDTPDPHWQVVDSDGKKHDWRADITEALAKRQKPDGSWVNDKDQWMEGDPNLVTGYALMALSYCKPKKLK